MKQIGINYVLNTKNSVGLLLLFLFTSCQYFRQDVEKTPIAQVYQNYLFLEDVNPNIYSHKSKDDSIQSVRNYIEQWAYTQLLISQAKKNIDTTAITELVLKYKQDLLIDTYKNLLAEKYLDTVVTEAEILQSFEDNKQYFVARNHLVNPNILVFNKNNTRARVYKKWFFSDKIEFRDSLIKNSIYFSKFDIDTDNWQHLSTFKEHFPVFKRIRDMQILKKSKKFVLTDSLSLYLVLVNNSVKENEPLPLGYIKNDLRQLILNQRKQKVIEKLQNEIKSEAIKQKKFKIFKIEKHNE